MGLADDLGRVRRRSVKFAAQLAAGAALVACGAVFSRLSLPGVGTVELGPWAGPVTLVWVVAMTNAFNFMDGLDGLAGGCAALAAAVFALLAWLAGAGPAAAAAVVLAAAVLGFLPFNLPRARIFMGDAGSQFLGFAFAALAAAAAADVGAAGGAGGGAEGRAEGGVPPLAMPLLFLGFLFDTGLTILRRLAAGRNALDAHRGHLYQLLNRLGASHARVGLLHYAMTLLHGAGALWLIELAPAQRGAAFLPFLALQLLYAALVLRAAGRAGLLARD